MRSRWYPQIRFIGPQFCIVWIYCSRSRRFSPTHEDEFHQGCRIALLVLNVGCSYPMAPDLASSPLPWENSM